MNMSDEKFCAQSFQVEAFIGAFDRPMFGFTGELDDGTATLMAKIAENLRASGYAVSAIKHKPQCIDNDRLIKSSCSMRGTGCHEVMLIGDHRWALMHEYCNDPEPALGEILTRMAPADIVLVEGFKTIAVPKIEVHRPSLGQAALWRNDLSIIAVATDEEIICERIVLDINQPKNIAEFIVASLNLPRPECK